MLTVIIRRDQEPTVVQMTQEFIMSELKQINNSEMILEDSWSAGLKKVRTPFVCLVEADCVLSDNYLINLLESIRNDGHSPDKGTGGYLKLAMVSPALGVSNFLDRIFGYEIVGSSVYPSVDRKTSQVGFVPGSIIRYSSIKKDIDNLPWDDKNLIKMSATISAHLWNTNRRLRLNPDVIYVSTDNKLINSCSFNLTSKVQDIFVKERI